VEEQIQADDPDTELNESEEQHALAGGNHLAAHPEHLLQETTLHLRATLALSRDDRTMRSSNPVFWPVKAADLVVLTGYTAMNVGGNCLYLIQPDMVLFMESQCNLQLNPSCRLHTIS